MDEPTMEVIKEMTQRAHALRRGQAAELANAANHREHGDYTRAAIAAHAAEVSARMAGIYQQLAGVVSGTWLPSPEEVTEPAEGLGAGVGIVRWAPPQDASPAQLHQWKAFADALNQIALRQKYRTDDLIPAAHATQKTGPVSPEDLPQPDPLSAPPAEANTAQRTEPDAADPWTPPVFPLGRPVTLEPPAENNEPEPAGAARGEEPEPAPEPEPGRKGYRVRRRGRRRAGSADRNAPSASSAQPPRPDDGGPAAAATCQPTRSGAYPAVSADGVVDRVAEAEQQRAYPDRPVHGLAAQGPERQNPSALLLPSQGADDATQALPPVNGDGGGHG